ncbi:hypothetical protein [Streptoalloteichus hindustanus]|uniref:Uncharacterized protein n=1 Tax=Streptoalloteichus hindustanus TaxID=2017 RepID=A0A1M5EVR5_STRHI|nr:hypothetical protein [Streptoalloteichus hindustanus]SHF83314.1 hypothetical protein SAMN05444320_105160 [Streptoalloteichus hindustanus]
MLQPSGQPSESNPHPESQNTISGSVSGPTVQAGAIHGDLHFHLGQTAPPATPLPVSAQATGKPSPPLRVSKVAGGWVLALLPLLIFSAALGAVVDAATRQGPLVVKLALDLVIVALGVLALRLWSLVARRPFGALTAVVLDRCTPRRLAALSRTTLTVILSLEAVLALTLVVQEVSRGSGDPRSAGANGALVFLLATGFLIARVLVRPRMNPEPRANPVP